MGNWIGYGQDMAISTPEGPSSYWSNTTANYDPNQYLTSHLQGFINSLPGSTSKYLCIARAITHVTSRQQKLTVPDLLEIHSWSAC